MTSLVYHIVARCAGWLLLPAVGWACSCSPFPTICTTSQPGAKSETAIFIGRAVSQYPKFETAAEYASAIAGPTVEARKAKIIELWKGVITAKEIENIQPFKGAKTRDILEPFGSAGTDFPVQTRFEVEEVLHGPVGAQLETFTLHPSAGGCDAEFVVGKRYLVEAGRNGPDGRWTVSMCGRTAEFQESDSLDLLRRAQDRKIAEKYLFGIVRASLPLQHPMTIRVRAESGQEFEATTRPDGTFLLPGLPSDLYTISAPGYRTDKVQGTLDLRQYSCSDVRVQLEPNRK